MSVFPIARETYERREEQNFREYVRRNVDQANSAVIALADTFRFSQLPVYADNAAAGAGGLIQGQFYRTATGALMVKL